MLTLWKIRSGEFAGWRDRDLLYDSDGENMGVFDGEIAFSIRVDYIGELYDEQTIGKRRSIGTVGVDKVVGRILVLDFPQNKYAVLNDTADLADILPTPADYVDGVVSCNKFYVNVRLGEDTIQAVGYDCGSSSSTLVLPRDLWQWATGLNGDEPEVIRDSVLSWGKYIDILSAPA